MIIGDSTYNYKRISTVCDKEYAMNDIIDITNESYDLSKLYEHEKQDAPYWAHQYIYSYADLSTATIEQKKFYFLFKKSFLEGIYLDLKGNSNYAFILLFNLQDIYQEHKDIDKLEKQFEILGRQYPKTKPYCNSFLINILEKNGDTDRIKHLSEQNSQDSYDHDYWKFGNKYKEKLKLNNEELELLNKLWNQSNNFCDIEACKIEIIKLYIAVFKVLEQEYMNEGTTLEQIFNYIAGIYVKKQYSYQKGSVNYKYSIEDTKRYFYRNIFKYCENSVREIYEHKRKLSTDLSLNVSEANDKYAERVIPVLERILSELAVKIVRKPNSATEKELYSLNTSRWKTKFTEITGKYNGDYKHFKSEIVSLGILNENNPSIEHIFYEASKFISKHHRETALTLYIYYLHYDLRSESFENRELTKTIQKNIFESNKQLHDFQAVVSQYIHERDLFKALKAIPPIFETKRKKIEVNRNIVREVESLHTETVNLLNEYLRDEFEDEDLIIQSTQVNDEEVEIKITDKKAEVTTEFKKLYSSELDLSETQILILNLFAKCNLVIQVDEFKNYSKENGWFAKQAIDKINETCYDFLDDVLIEEEEDYYIITEHYFQTILAQ